MNEVNPIPCCSRERSCSCRRRYMCSTRCSNVSPNPMTFVALVVNPSDCASSITLSQFAGSPFFGDTSFRTSSTNISAPPPGRPCIPAALSRVKTSSVESSLTSAIPSISMGLKQSIAIDGCRVQSSRKRFSYHSNESSGFTPPCIRIRTPSIFSSS